MSLSSSLPGRPDRFARPSAGAFMGSFLAIALVVWS